MELLHYLRNAVANLFKRERMNDDLKEELKHHLAMAEKSNLETGMTPTEARRAARVEFGGVEKFREECRDAWGTRVITNTFRDLRFSLRMLVKSPGFTTVAVVTLGLGIGVNATMFSFVRDAILRPLVRDKQMHLASLYNSRKGENQGFRQFTFAEFEALREPSEVFSDVAAFYFSVDAVGRPNDLRRRLVGVVSENYFSLLGAQPLQGRFFSTEESRPEAAIPVVVANFAFWERLGRPDDFLGSTIRVNQRDYTVIGMTPAGFGGLHVSIGPDVWLPLGEASQLAERERVLSRASNLNLVGSLQTGLSIDVAQTRLASVNRRINTPALSGNDGPRGLVIAPPSRFNLSDTRPADEGILPVFASLGMGLAITVLIVACLNLANMLLARGTARQKEIAIRLSVGATRWRVVRQLLAEGLLLALIGGTLGIFLSYWSNEMLLQTVGSTFASGTFALNIHTFVDLPVIAAISFFCLLATLASSLGPALRITRSDLVTDLKLQSGDSAATGRWNRFFSLGHCLVMAQMAFSLALLFSSALFVRGSWHARTLDLGFQTGSQLVANLDYGMPKLSNQEVSRRQEAVLSRASFLPGVESAALASNVPYNFDLPFRRIFAADSDSVGDAQDNSRRQASAGYTAVSRGYFSTLGVQLLRGRDFSSTESSGTGGSRVVVVDETLARALFGEEEALGRSVFVSETAARNGDINQAARVIGIVRSPRNAVFDSTSPRRFYLPLGQVHESDTYLHVKATEPSAIPGLLPALRRELQTLDPETPILFVRPLADFVKKNINMVLVDVAAMVFGGFGGIALLLAVVGVYGVKAHAVARRTREIGIRVALGAKPGDVVALILKQGVLQTLVGLSLGLMIALLAGQVLASMLYRVSPTDPIALVVSATILAIAALLASWLPARRATKVNPLTALRTE